MATLEQDLRAFFHHAQEAREVLTKAGYVPMCDSSYSPDTDPERESAGSMRHCEHWCREGRYVALHRAHKIPGMGSALHIYHGMFRRARNGVVSLVLE